MRMDCEKLSRLHQVLGLQRTGMMIDNGEKAITFYIRAEEKVYPSTQVDMEVPSIMLRSLTTADLIYYQYKLEDKIRWLYQRLRELQREARHFMRHKLHDGVQHLDGKYITGGVT